VVIAWRRFGILGFAVLSLLGLVVMTDNRLGADGGGAVVLGVGVAVLGARLLRLRATGFVTLLLTSATVVLAIVAANLRQPGPNHLRSAFASGVDGLVAVARDRVVLAYDPALAQWPMVAPLGLAFLVALALAYRGARQRTRRDLLLALAVALITSLLVNDSAAYELAAGIAVVGALARFTPTSGRVTVKALASAALETQPQPVPTEAGPE
jgi:hypothetical protein